MRIREETSIETGAPGYDREQVMESIAELEEQYEQGVLEWPAYAMKKRALIRML